VVAADLVKRNVAAAVPDRLWVADITYLKTSEGFLYLAFLVDACSRKLVGWAMESHLRSELVVDALQMAVWRRRLAPGLIHHSDQGVQYTARSFGKKLEEVGIVPSMGRVGSAYDNSLAESFVATLMECELGHHEHWPTREAAGVSVFKYLEGFYNRRRLHHSLGYVSPEDFEENRIQESSAAQEECVRASGGIPSFPSRSRLARSVFSRCRRNLSAYSKIAVLALWRFGRQ
jgi:putative transposase